ncbi:MAG: hypothetical protein WD512_11375 [Candidatus Paceibacterota bacterium]
MNEFRMDIYDLVKECPLLIRQILYQYLPQVKYKSMGYIILDCMNNANTDIKFSVHALLDVQKCRKINDFANNDIINEGGGNGIIKKVIFYAEKGIRSMTYRDYFQITVKEITEDPHQIAVHMGIHKKKYMSNQSSIIYDIIFHIQLWSGDENPIPTI